MPWQITSALVASSAAVVVWRTAQQARAIGYQRLHWPAVVAVLTVLGAATVYTARLSSFMLDETRVDLSVLPNRAFFRTHSCLSAYTEAARLAPSGANIFDPEQYSDPARPGQNAARSIGQFEVDLYQYPPPFLVLPRAAHRRGPEFSHHSQGMVRRAEHRAPFHHGGARAVDRRAERAARAAARAGRLALADARGSGFSSATSS